MPTPKAAGLRGRHATLWPAPLCPTKGPRGVIHTNWPRNPSFHEVPGSLHGQCCCFSCLLSLHCMVHRLAARCLWPGEPCELGPQGGRTTGGCCPHLMTHLMAENSLECCACSCSGAWSHHTPTQWEWPEHQSGRRCRPLGSHLLRKPPEAIVSTTYMASGWSNCASRSGTLLTIRVRTVTKMM